MYLRDWDDAEAERPRRGTTDGMEPLPFPSQRSGLMRARLQRRASVWRTLRSGLTSILALLILASALLAARWIMRGVQWQPAMTASVPVVEQPTLAPSVPVAAPAPLGMGATQSAGGVTMTVTLAATLPATIIVQAPKGMLFYIFQVRMVNTSPSQTMQYSGYNFLLTVNGQTHHEDYADLGNPLGMGVLPPSGSVSGEIAFLLDPTFSNAAVMPRILYVSTGGSAILAWEMTTSTTAP